MARAGRWTWGAAFARIGYDTSATDLARVGLDQLDQAARAAGLTVTTEEAAATELPFDDASFD